MQQVSATLLNVLLSQDRDLLDVYEFFADTVTDLDPVNATLRLAPTTLFWGGNRYQQQIISRGDVSRYFSSTFNSASVTISNIDRTIAATIAAAGNFEGYRLVIRAISRQVPSDSLVLFVGRCEKAYDVDNETIQINSKQDLGATENEFPPDTFAPKCPLEFKGTECLAGEALSSKSAEYQAGTVCNKSHANCVFFSNQNAFQGTRFNGKQGNFKVSQTRGGAGGALLGLIGLGNKRVTKQWSAQDDAPYGRPVPFGFGRTQIELTAIISADTGQYLAGQWIVGMGELDGLLNVRNVSNGWNDPHNTLPGGFHFYAQHMGKFGTDASQSPVGDFASSGDRHSHKAYIEANLRGNNPDTGDAAPTIVAIASWIKVPTWDGLAFTTEAWSDKGPEILRYILTSPRFLNYDESWIDTASFGAAVKYCDEPLIDETGANDLQFSTQSGLLGTDFKRYRTTGELDVYYFRHLLGIDSDLPSTREETTITTFDAEDPPTEDPPPTTRTRRRYTCNFHVIDRLKVSELLFKKLLPSFKGYLITGADGKLQLRIDKPQIYFAIPFASAGQTTIKIQDISFWNTAMVGSPAYLIVGWGEDDSEVVGASSNATYDTSVNEISTTASSTGTAGMSAPGAFLAAGTPIAPGYGTYTVTATGSPGDTITATIDGVPSTYTVTAADSLATIAEMLATLINANTDLNSYIRATGNHDGTFLVEYVSGFVDLSSALTLDHGAGLCMHVSQAFAHIGGSYYGTTRGNVHRNTFKWPLGGKQSSYNQFVITYADAGQDFQTTEIRENDYPHQNKTNKVNKLDLDGACIDNYHQADRILQSARYRYRDGDFFCSWGSDGAALLLEEGDVVVVNHDNMPGQRNLPLRLEEVKITPDWKVNILGRKYTLSQYPETPAPRTGVLTTGVGWPSEAPGAPISLTIDATEPGSIHGSFDFDTGFVAGQYALVSVKKFGDSNFIDTGLRILPDANDHGEFDISGLPGGSTDVQVQLVAFETGEFGGTDEGNDTVDPPGMGGGGALANPTASVGLSAVNGTSIYGMRSDASPPLSQSIVPTWTGQHLYTQATSGVANSTFATYYTPPVRSTNGTSQSPRLDLAGETYDGSAHTTVVQLYNQPLANDGVTMQLVIRMTYNGGTAKPLLLTQAGLLTLTGGLTAAGVLTMGTGPTTVTDSAGKVISAALNTVAVAQGGTGLTSGTSGGILAYTASGVLASSGALTANLPVIGGGAGVAPTVGTRSGNTTAFATVTGTLTSGHLTAFDTSGNVVDAGAGIPAVFANPTGTIGLTIVNGSASTAMRSDGAPALSQAIVPTWTGQHIFQQATAGITNSTMAVYLTPPVRATNGISFSPRLDLASETYDGSGHTTIIQFWNEALANDGATTRLVVRMTYNGGTAKPLFLTSAGLLTLTGGITAAGILTMGSGPVAITDATGNLLAAAAATPTGSGNWVLATSPTLVTPTIAKLANLTTNGFVKTGSGDGTLSIDTSTYLTSSTGVSSITGTSNQITASAATGAVVLSLPAHVKSAAALSLFGGCN